MRSSPVARRVTLAVFACAWAALLVGGRSRLFRDPGTFWHTLTGERIFSLGFPHVDWLTFTAVGHPWIAHQWLGECAMAVLHRLGGLDALLVATSAVLALLVAWLFHRLASAGVPVRWAVLLTSLAMLASVHHFHVRPHLVSILLFAWVYGRLADVEAGTAPLAALRWFPLAFLVWSNVHGAALGGLATAALAFVGWSATWLLRMPSPVRRPRDAVTLAALLAACVATAAVTPYGLDTARTWATIMRSPMLPVVIVEHASMLRTHAWGILPFAVVYVAALAATLPARPRITSLLPLVWLVLAVERVRHAPFFAVAAAIALCDLLSRVRWLPWSERPAASAAPSASFPAASIAASVLAGIVGIAAVHAVAPGATRLARLDGAHWPVDLLPDLRRVEHELPPGSPVINDQLFGAFLEYHVPGLRVLVDDRWELFGDDFMLAATRADAAWLDRWTERADVRAALALRGSALDAWLGRSEGWRLVAASPFAALYRRDRDGSAAAAPDQLEPPLRARWDGSSEPPAYGSR